ncbi:hypothetical protein PENSPDRAFT_588880, partial [Peniophora sp. CONT]
MLKCSYDSSTSTTSIIVTRDNLGKTALHDAAGEGHANVCHLLLEHGASLDDTDDNGNTPLHLATWSGNLDAIRLFLE